MFKQRSKTKKRLTTCRHPKHLFSKNKGKCLCGNYYKDNGRLLRNKRTFFVVGTTADFRYKGKRETRRKTRRILQKMLKK